MKLLKFEKNRDILSILSEIKGYSVKGNVIFYNGTEFARSYNKKNFYKYLESHGLDYKKIICKKL